MDLRYKYSDILGASASALCLLHCLATPLLFVAYSASYQNYNNIPIWWKSIDYVFIIVSLFAVFWTVKTTSKAWLKYGLWLSWGLLSFVICNEKLEIVYIPEYFIYIPTIALVLLHLYNRAYCKCDNEACCIN